MEDPNTNPASPPNVVPNPGLTISPDLTPNATPTANPSPSSRSSKLGLYGLVVGLVAVAGNMTIAYSTFSTGNSNKLIIVLYGVVALISLASLLGFALPSFKKNAYPNLLGLVGSLICLIAAYEAINALVALLVIGTA